MASTRGCDLADTDYAIGEPSKSNYFTAALAVTESEQGSPSSSCFWSAESGSLGGGTEIGQGSGVWGMEGVEEQIERSKSHWSMLAEPDSDEDGEVAEVSNVEVFISLQRHPAWGSFFVTFGGDGLKGWRFGGELVVGKKFAEGGQAELYEAQVTWLHPKDTEEDLEYGREWVLKVFKKGTFLRQLKAQLPRGYLKFYAEEVERWQSLTPKRLPRFYCAVHFGTLLRDGRFAFLMIKEHFDLRNLIERNMKFRSGKHHGPFSEEEAEDIMYQVALGMDWLHSHDIVHRDLKASNVLVYEFKSSWPKWQCVIADYECSVGVVGTGFFRAHEILQACKAQQLSQRLEVFSKGADVYRYGMTCYEILTGKLPFAGHPLNDYDLVLNGRCFVVPEYVEDWIRELLSRCWQANPATRPSFGEILDLLSTQSVAVRKREEYYKRKHGENFRSWHDTEN